MNIRQRIQLAFVIAALPLLISIHAVPVPAAPVTTIPLTLADMDKHADQIINTLLAKDKVASRKHYQQLHHDIKLLGQLIKAAPYEEQRSRELLMTYSWLRVMNQEMGDKSWVGAAVAANQLSGMIIQTSHFPTLEERDIAWLNYLGREMELLTLEDPVANADLLSIRLITLENTWGRLRDELIRKFRNKPLLIQGDMLVDAIKSSKKPAETVALAKKLLDFIVQLEHSQ
ncbi:hypothetical protein [Mariprofundus ferrooxydans]|uniref:hypothetical protein n=1 Tax=Mariprofundus ferrooxydans TaxID=314344 RepID=UPI0003730335|nr:hypothetical protein [Mariprofundus ferrooxydans]